MKHWWFIVYEEYRPYREGPLVAETITKMDPVTYLRAYRKSVQDQPGIRITIRAFWLMDRRPTRNEIEEFCQDGSWAADT